MRALAFTLVAVVTAGCGVVSKPAPSEFVYGCVPVAVNSGGNYEVAVHVHNPNATNVTVSRTPQNKDGANLAGQPRHARRQSRDHGQGDVQRAGGRRDQPRLQRLPSVSL
jgi:hypothetical protein